MATKGVKSSVIVNGQTCQSTLIAKGKTCEALNGETKEACSSGQSDIASWISSDSTASKCCYPAGKVCTAGNPSASCSIILKADCAKYGCPYVSGDTCSSNSNVDCSKVPSDKCGIYNCGLPAA
jgi:hypothetical protein